MKLLFIASILLSQVAFAQVDEDWYSCEYQTSSYNNNRDMCVAATKATTPAIVSCANQLHDYAFQPEGPFTAVAAICSYVKPLTLKDTVACSKSLFKKYPFNYGIAVEACMRATPLKQAAFEGCATR